MDSSFFVLYALFPVVTMPVFLDLFGAPEKAFFVFKGFDLA